MIEYKDAYYFFNFKKIIYCKLHSLYNFESYDFFVEIFFENGKNEKFSFDSKKEALKFMKYITKSKKIQHIKTEKKEIENLLISENNIGGVK